MGDSYARRIKSDDDTFSVETPGRGVTMIDGLTEYMAAVVTEKINRAYQHGVEDTQGAIIDILGIRECRHD